MSTRTLALALMSAAVITSGAACQTPSAPTAVTKVSAAPVSTAVALTRQPCDLLTPAVAKKYVGDNAERQLFYDSDPPVSVGDDACYYTGSTREVSVAIYPRPTDPTAPVNHFDVIQPQNRIEGLSFEAYRFGPGESVVAVKGGLLVSVKVANTKGAWTDQDRSDDVDLANLIVPQVN
jgi:hypothetical protein